MDDGIIGNWCERKAVVVLRPFYNVSCCEHIFGGLTGAHSSNEIQGQAFRLIKRFVKTGMQYNIFRPVWEL